MAVLLQQKSPLLKFLNKTARKTTSSFFIVFFYFCCWKSIWRPWWTLLRGECNVATVPPVCFRGDWSTPCVLSRGAFCRTLENPGKNSSTNNIEFLHCFYLFLLTESDFETHGHFWGSKIVKSLKKCWYNAVPTPIRPQTSALKPFSKTDVLELKSTTIGTDTVCFRSKKQKKTEGVSIGS